VTGLEEVVLGAAAESRNAGSVEYLGIVIGRSKPENPLISTAWTVLEAANDLGDVGTLEACQRVIDASLSGTLPERSDTEMILDFFN
jgi:hypothetical protein